MKCNRHNKKIQINAEHTKVIACATVIEEMLTLMPPNMCYEVLDFGLHVSPNKLKNALQKAIDSSAANIETIILGYGLCAQAVVGLKAEERILIVPRVDDCIAIFLGSEREYQRQHSSTPGTYYLTKGWIEVGNTPFDEHDALVELYGEKKAQFLTGQILKNYTRLALINTGQAKMEYYRTYARHQAQRFGLQYEEIQGSNALIKKMLYGPFDSDFVIATPGKTISFMDFKKT